MKTYMYGKISKTVNWVMYDHVVHSRFFILNTSLTSMVSGKEHKLIDLFVMCPSLHGIAHICTFLQNKASASFQCFLHPEIVVGIEMTLSTS